jgi:hypothetical protein
MKEVKLEVKETGNENTRRRSIWGIMLYLILQEKGKKRWTAFKWLRAGSHDRLL